MPRDFQDAQMQQYFSSLPLFVQESIKQSGVALQTESELKNFAENMMKRN